jgi:hypothetical protein
MNKDPKDGIEKVPPVDVPETEEGFEETEAEQEFTEDEDELEGSED